MLSILKEYFRPTAAKLIVFLLLGGYFSFIFKTSVASAGKVGIIDLYFNPTTVDATGFPLQYISASEILPVAGNLVIWYIISCLIVLCYEKIKTKGKKK